MIEHNASSITDSTDWLDTALPGLAPVEAALRCQVCKDFYKTPMMTSCCHTFCSVCIRRALANDGRCPLCRASDQELKLRANWSVEELVEAFAKTRDTTLNIATAAKLQTRNAPLPLKRKVSASENTGNPDDIGAKRIRSSARLSQKKEIELAQEIQSEHSEEDSSDEYVPEADDGLVPCPSCQKRMKQWQVFGHLDKCPGPSQAHDRPDSTQQPAPRNPFALSSQRPENPPQRLPAINYSMLKEQALRKKLAELGISSTGSRAVLEKRHREWLTIWNANCDSTRPRKRADLLRDLDVWEKTQGTRAPAASQLITGAPSVRDKNFDVNAWATKHDTSFKDLIARARNSKDRATSGDANPSSITRTQEASTETSDMESGLAEDDGVMNSVNGQTTRLCVDERNEEDAYNGCDTGINDGFSKGHVST